MSRNEEQVRLREADNVITQSEGVSQDLQELGVSVDAVIPNAANEDLLPSEYPRGLADSLGISDDTTTIIYAGSLHQWKNDIELLIETTAGLSWDNVKLLIVGGDEDRIDELDEFTIDLGIDQIQIKFVGRVPHREVFEYLSVSDIGVIPLKPDTPQARKYTSPIKLFEYLLCDLQIVASDVPAINSIENPNIHRYEPGVGPDMKQAFETAKSANPSEEPTKYTYRWRAEQIDNLL